MSAFFPPESLWCAERLPERRIVQMVLLLCRGIRVRGRNSRDRLARQILRLQLRTEQIRLVMLRLGRVRRAAWPAGGWSCVALDDAADRRFMLAIAAWAGEIRVLRSRIDEGERYYARWKGVA